MAFVSRKLRLKITLGVGLALVCLLAPLNWMQYELQRRTAVREMEALAAVTGSVVAHSLEDAMLSNSRPAIQAIIDGIVQSPEIRSIFLFDTAARIAASPGGLQNGQHVDRTDPSCIGCHENSGAERPRGITVTGLDGEPLFRTVTPIVNRPICHECHAAQDRLNGVLYMDFAMSELSVRLEQGRRNAFWASVAIILLTTTVLYFLLSWLVVTPLERLAQSMYSFGRGQRTARVDTISKDEVGIVAGVFNDMATTIQQQGEESDRLYAELEKNDAARRQLLIRLITAREEEQQRLARRIHDVLGQLLTGMMLYLRLSSDAIPDDLKTAREPLSRAGAILSDIIEQTQNLVTYLRPAVLDDVGLAPAIREEMAQRLAPVQIEGRLDQKGDLSHLPHAVTTAVFRITQEALVNVVRHAGAQTVWIRMAADSAELVVSIEDDGFGPGDREPLDGDEHAYTGTGIMGMQERAAALGGQLRVGKREPHGTVVRLRLPLNADVSA